MKTIISFLILSLLVIRCGAVSIDYPADGSTEVPLKITTRGQWSVGHVNGDIRLYEYQADGTSKLVASRREAKTPTMTIPSADSDERPWRVISTEMESWTPPAKAGRQEALDQSESEKEASDRAAKLQLRKTKGEVLLVDAGKVWVSLGTEKGFVKGDHLKIYKAMEKKNKAGTVVALDYQPVGVIELSKVQKDKSCGEANGVAIEEGWVVAAADFDINELD